MQVDAPGSTCVDYSVGLSDPTDYYYGYHEDRVC
jgi:hypothetical protein